MTINRLKTALVFYGIGLGISVGALAWLSLRAPERIAVRYIDGVPDDWIARGVAAALFGGAIVFLFGVVPLAVSYADRMPAAWVTVPNRAHWVSPQNRLEFRRRYAGDILVFCTLAGLLVTALTLGSVQASVAGAALPAWTLVTVVVCLGAMVAVVAHMQRWGYRIPGDADAVRE